MTRKNIVKLLPFALMLALLMSGCAQQTSSTTAGTEAKAPAAQKQDPNVLKGPIVGKSNKAKTISITVGSGDAPVSVTVEPSGQFAYVASENSSDVSQYRIEADGTLTPLDPDEVDAGRNPTAITAVGALE